jgi:hypothetical protein
MHACMLCNVCVVCVCVYIYIYIYICTHTYVYSDDHGDASYIGANRLCPSVHLSLPKYGTSLCLSVAILYLSSSRCCCRIRKYCPSHTVTLFTGSACTAPVITGESGSATHIIFTHRQRHIRPQHQRYRYQGACSHNSETDTDISAGPCIYTFTSA